MNKSDGNCTWDTDTAHNDLELRRTRFLTVVAAVKNICTLLQHALEMQIIGLDTVKDTSSCTWSEDKIHVCNRRI